MKKIIDGKMYNTETATNKGEWNNGIYSNDFRNCSETLYQKKTGEFFLHGSGGAMSKYAETFGNNTCGMSVIIPLSEVEAQNWVELHLDVDEYVAIFGEVAE